MSGHPDAPGTSGPISVPRRRGPSRVVVVMAFLVIVLVVAVAVVVDQVWVSAPDLAVGSRHQVTVQGDYPCGANSVVLRQVQYGGHVWWVDGAPAVPLPSGTRATLVITRPVTSGVPTGSTDTADLLVGGHVIAMAGGGQSGPVFSCPLR